ncbi:hypothetical protein C2G38_2139494 [Gigaspora rosea]|uniref:Uncharacterized protein n=1 Tax=Gigaspora rosea TaxID=44941 RepID=A0A397VPP4_9GLOM|nr:hypothetical protein C2G38_2139494 [Gigaspora rosea]
MNQSDEYVSSGKKNSSGFLTELLEFWKNLEVQNCKKFSSISLKSEIVIFVKTTALQNQLRNQVWKKNDDGSGTKTKLYKNIVSTYLPIHSNDECAAQDESMIFGHTQASAETDSVDDSYDIGRCYEIGMESLTEKYEGAKELKRRMSIVNSNNRRPAKMNDTGEKYDEGNASGMDKHGKRRLLSALGSERLCPENHPNGLSQQYIPTAFKQSPPDESRVFAVLLPRGSRNT